MGELQIEKRQYPDIFNDGLRGVGTCGKTHMTTVDDVVVGHGVIDSIPTLLRKYNNTDKTGPPKHI